MQIEYKEILNAIETRLSEFSDIWKNGDSKDLFAELSFCIFTPQSNARYCWETVCTLRDNGLLFSGNSSEILAYMNKVRFNKRKSLFVVEARENMLHKQNLRDILSNFTDSYQRREWLVSNIKGYGYKESTHFLRNIGLGEDLAILDRHILKNLVNYGVIESIPQLNKSKYLEIEKKMQEFAKEQNIPMLHLDLIFWHNARGEIYK